MPIQVNPADAIAYLEQFLVNNKARGMVAELALERELGIKGTPAGNKLLSGGWIISPKVERPQYHRYVITVLPHLYRDEEELQNQVTTLERDRGWQALATFMIQSSIGIIVSGAWSAELPPSLNSLRWENFVYEQERLLPASNNNPFQAWPGNRGRANPGSVWHDDVVARYRHADDDDLIELALRQAFYYGYLKRQLRKPLEDPYDVDAFVVSFTGSVMPVEIKEKSPTEGGEFGIDAGRILMLLRLCLATDSNALYLIRQVDNSLTRELVGWRYITLSNMIIGCRWNLQAGGAGMGGGATQTVMISGSLFKDFSLTNFSEEWLAENRSLQGSVRATAMQLAGNLSRYLVREIE